MRRALFAITGLAASTTAMVVLKGSPGVTSVATGEVPAAGQPVAPAGGAAPDDAPSAGKPAPDRSTGASRSPRPDRSTGAPEQRPDDAATATTRPPAPPRTTAPRSATRTVTGPVVTNEFGNVQVQITLSGSRIVNVVALELPEKTAQSDVRSDQVDGRYSGSSGLVVQQQSADLDAVSGATATSTSYQQSLQAAIDRAG